MRLLNVRLGREDAALAEKLKARGVSLSDVVRRAIREEACRGAATDGGDVRALLAEMVTAFPDPAGLPPRVDPLDRRAVQRAVRAKLLKRP